MSTMWANPKDDPRTYGKVTHLLNMVSLAACVLLGAAALHPSVREVGERAQSRTPRLSP